MKEIIRILFIVMLAITFSCEGARSFFYCDECLEEEPLNTALELKLSKEYLATGQIEIYIYEGDLEDDILLANFNYAINYEVAINKKYTVLVKYTLAKTFICIDSTTPRVTYYPNLCDEPCYYVSGRALDLRLKYQ